MRVATPVAAMQIFLRNEFPDWRLGQLASKIGIGEEEERRGCTQISGIFNWHQEEGRRIPGIGKEEEEGKVIITNGGGEGEIAGKYQH
jgi:hypothetical protein